MSPYNESHAMLERMAPPHFVCNTNIAHSRNRLISTACYYPAYGPLISGNLFNSLRFEEQAHATAHGQRIEAQH